MLSEVSRKRSFDEARATNRGQSLGTVGDLDIPDDKTLKALLSDLDIDGTYRMSLTVVYSPVLSVYPPIYDSWLRFFPTPHSPYLPVNLLGHNSK